jgi:repressor LexA
MLTARQRDCLRFIETFQAENDGASPTFDEIRGALGLAGKSGVFRLLDGLEERGFIRRLPNRVRAIELIDRSPLAHVPTEALRAELERRGAVL